MSLLLKAESMLMIMEVEEIQDNFWWQNKIQKIAKATGLLAP